MKNQKIRIQITAEKEKNNGNKKRKKTSHLVEVVVDARIICRRVSERQARRWNQVCPQPKGKM